jgi:hypothetical protein
MIAANTAGNPKPELDWRNESGFAIIERVRILFQ